MVGFCALMAAAWGLAGPQAEEAAAVFDLGTARIELDGGGRVRSIRFADGGTWPACPQPAFCLQTDGGDRRPVSVGRNGTVLAVSFEGGASAELSVGESPGVLVLESRRIRSPEPIQALRCFGLAAPEGARISGTLNAAWADGRAVAVMAGGVNVQTFVERAGATAVLAARTVRRYGLEPVRVAVLACGEKDFPAAVERLEEAADLPRPRPGGTWNKRSPWVARSYLFLTNFRQEQVEEALRIARRGAFDMILLGQESWCRSAGHYEVNRKNFPDGLPGLRQALDRFRAAGFKVGLHFLAASIDPHDPYLTPVPDERLVKDAQGVLASDLDEKADVVPLEAPPEGFPEADGGYEGKGTVVQIDRELIQYTAPMRRAPFGLKGCRRGFLGTKAAPHRKGAPVAHLMRSYGYFLFDLDSTLRDEVAENFARVANALGVDMIYFDGAERLQGDHWYYNPKLIKAFYDRLLRKDVLLQASSYSHYSWHLLSRHASADGHGDIKGYLDERSAGFGTLARDLMPLDIGWYYGYDPSATPDLFEYVLGATVGYGASMSFQVSVDAAARHPFAGEILDRIARYERLRLEGRVDEEMRGRLRIDPVLAGRMDPERREKLRDRRREFRLLEEPGGPIFFQPVAYGPWREIRALDGRQNVWEVEVRKGPARVGFTLHVQGGPWLVAGPSYEDPRALTLESFDDLGPYAADPGGRAGVQSIPPGQGGRTSAGVTHRLESVPGDARVGRCAVYTAFSTSAGGWSFFGRSFPKALDLSWHRAIGFWLRGDGKGGSFKLQLLDERGAAADYYVVNDYSGWRYHQLPRPAVDPIDYSRVRQLGLYYNGLPAGTAVACAVDDVKALRTLDRRRIVNPWIELGGKRFLWKTVLEEGQYLVYEEGEGSRRYGPGGGPPEEVPLEGPPGPILLPPGTHPATFGCAAPLTTGLRARITLQLPGRHEIR